MGCKAWVVLTSWYKDASYKNGSCWGKDGVVMQGGGRNVGGGIGAGM